MGDMNSMGKVVSAANAASFQIGDRVSGLAIEGDVSSALTGAITSIQGAALFLDAADKGHGTAVWASTATLVTTGAATAASAAGASVATAVATSYPSSGAVNFNEPLFDDDGDAVSVVTVLAGTGLHIVVLVNGANVLVDEDGEDASGETIVKNAAGFPAKTLYGILYKDEDDTYYVGDETYSSIDDAERDGRSSDDFIGVFVITKAEKAAPETAAPAPAPADGTAALGTAAGGFQEMSVAIPGYGTRTVRVGDMLQATRKRHGRRNVQVIKLRRDPKRSVFVQANDGSDPYWALNKNLSIGR